MLLTDGHLSWFFFALVVYTLAGVLVTDCVWRLVRVRARLLLPAALGVWGVGILLGILLMWQQQV